jgi:hypothetical protein
MFLLQLSYYKYSEFIAKLTHFAFVRTFSDLQDDLAEIQNNEERARYCCQRLLCRTLAGNNVYILTITSPGTQASQNDKY